MINIIRIKAVSLCMGIRRAALTYAFLKDGLIDLSLEPHPLKKFISAEIKGTSITVLGKTETMLVGEEVYFYRTTPMDAGGKMENEVMTLGTMILPLDKEMEEYYEKAIHDGYMFDQWDGEFEYLLGLMEEYSEKNEETARKWYLKAENKKFIFSLNKGE